MKNEHKARKLLFNAKTNYEEIRKKKGLGTAFLPVGGLKMLSVWASKRKKMKQINKNF